MIFQKMYQKFLEMLERKIFILSQRKMLMYTIANIIIGKT
jgi:hypothetical protein